MTQLAIKGHETRGEEIIKQVEIYANDVSNLAEWSDGWEDNNPRMFKGQTEKMEEREIAFMDWWLENHKGKLPTFADAIAWADKTMVERACNWISQSYTSGILDWKNCDSIIEDFRKAMEE